MKPHLWGVLCALLMAQCLAWEAGGAVLADSARVICRGTRHVLTVNLETEQIQKDCGVDEYWGASGGRPRVIVRMNIVLDDTVVDVPRSAFGDLAAPESVTCRARGTNHEVTILGGEAATAYRAHIYIRNGAVVRRRVESREMPQVWEATEYHRAFSEND